MNNKINLDVKIVIAILRICYSAKPENQKSEEVVRLLAKVGKGDHADMIKLFLLGYSDFLCSKDGSDQEIEVKLRSNDEAISSALSSDWGKELQRSLKFCVHTFETMDDTVMMADEMLSFMCAKNPNIERNVAILSSAASLLSQYNSEYINAA